MDDQCAIESERLLAIWSSVRVVEVRSGLLDNVLIYISAARWHRVLRDISRSVHSIRHHQSVPMHGRRLGQMVRKIDPHMIALGKLEARPRYLPIDCVGSHLHAWQNVPVYDRRIEIEDFYSVLQARREYSISSRIDRSGVADAARVDSCHVPHCIGRSFWCRDHAWGHNCASHVFCSHAKIYEGRGYEHPRQ